MKTINYWGVGAAALFGWFLGFLWYGVLFTVPWMALEGITAADGVGEEWRMGLGVIEVIIVAFGLDWLRRISGVNGFVPGLKTGLWAALFFTVTAVWLRFIYALKPLALVSIDSAYLLLQIAVGMGIVCAFYGFRKTAAASGD